MKTSLSLLAVAFVAATSLFLEPLALAQSDADKALARDLFQDASKALADKKFEEARDKFARADALYRAPTILLGLARAYVGLGKYVEAKETYNQVLREKLPPGASEAFLDAKRDAGREVATLDDKIGTGTIQVSADGPSLPSGLAATLDEQELKQAAFGLKRPMNPGAHRLTVTAPGYDAVERRFEVVAKKDVLVDVKLVKGAVAAASVSSSGGAAPTSTASADTAATSTSAPTGSTSTPTEAPAPGGLQRILGWSAVGLGGAGLLLGGITGGIAVARHGRLSEQCPNGSCAGVPDAQSKIDAYETMGTLSTVGFIVGGVFATTGVVLLVTAPKADTTQTAMLPLTVSVGPSSVHATLAF